MAKKTPNYINMYQELPSGVPGYTINLGQHSRGWDIFVCSPSGVPVVCHTVAKKDVKPSEGQGAGNFVYDIGQRLAEEFFSAKKSGEKR